MTKTMIGIALALLAFAGCRQKDVRDFDVEVPALTQENEGAVRNALAGCVGVDMSALKFDLEKHRVTVRYDSMQTAKANILFAIAKIGLEASAEFKSEGKTVTNSVKPKDAAYVTNATSNAHQ